MSRYTVHEPFQVALVSRLILGALVGTVFSIGKFIGVKSRARDKEIEKRLGANEPNSDLVFSDLMDQVRAFTVYEHWFKGIVPYRTWVYYGCWLTSKGEESFGVDGDGRVMANFTFQYVARRMTL